MQVETVQTEELSQLDKLINEVIEQRKVVDIKLSISGKDSIHCTYHP